MEFGKNLSHAYIIVAQPEEGFAKAQELAAAILCEGESAKRPCGSCRHCKKSLRSIHPDVMVITRPSDDKGKMKKEIQVEQIRFVVSSAPSCPTRRKIRSTSFGTREP